MIARTQLVRGNMTTDNGFTLIEVLIAVVIVGILTAVALPQYSKFTTQSRRTDGHVALLRAIQELEQCKSVRYSYDGCSLSGTTSAEGFYSMSLTQSATAYTVTATGIGAQADDTGCKTMTVNHLNVKTPGAPSDCWPN